VTAENHRYDSLRQHLEAALREAARHGAITTPIQAALIDVLDDVAFLEAVATAELGPG
jgi:hypothetical protein